MAETAATDSCVTVVSVLQWCRRAAEAARTNNCLKDINCYMYKRVAETATTITSVININGYMYKCVVERYLTTTRITIIRVLQLLRKVAQATKTINSIANIKGSIIVQTCGRDSHNRQ